MILLLDIYYRIQVILKISFHPNLLDFPKSLSSRKRPNVFSNQINDYFTLFSGVGRFVLSTTGFFEGNAVGLLGEAVGRLVFLSGVGLLVFSTAGFLDGNAVGLLGETDGRFVFGSAVGLLVFATTGFFEGNAVG